MEQGDQAVVLYLSRKKLHSARCILAKGPLLMVNVTVSSRSDMPTP